MIGGWDGADLWWRARVFMCRYWQTATAMPSRRVFVFGGFSETEASAQLHMLDPDKPQAKAWLPLNNLPTRPPGPVYFHAAAALDAHIFYHGGVGCTEVTDPA